MTMTSPSGSSGSSGSAVVYPAACDKGSGEGGGGPGVNLDAETVESMREVREGIDELDRQIVGLLGKRMRFIEAAARIKPAREAVRDEWRKADVICKVRGSASKVDFPEKLAAEVYEVLVEGSIAHEFLKFDARGGADAGMTTGNGVDGE